jgi:hypothetical protein
VPTTTEDDDPMFARYRTTSDIEADQAVRAERVETPTPVGGTAASPGCRAAPLDRWAPTFFKEP